MSFLPQKEILACCLLFILSNLPLFSQDNTCPPFSQSTHEECSDGPQTPRVNIRKYRTIDGRFNNIKHEHWGATQIPMRRKAGVSHYANDDGNTLIDRGNPRMISNLVAAQEEGIENKDGLSALVFTFLQFLDHDITLTEGSNSTSSNDIPVPTGDPYFDPNGTGQAIIPFHRTEAVLGTGTPDRPRQSMNFLSAWIDGSGVYGNDHQRADWLRSGEYGKLKSYQSPYGELLPCNTATGDCSEDVVSLDAPFMAGNVDRCGQPVKVFVAGDIRANEQIGLTVLHTLFLREHNRICEVLKANGHTEDEWNYQYARKLVGGMIQSITYSEALPALGINFKAYRYKKNTRPDILNEFASAAYRLGHTMITEDLQLIGDDCTYSNINIGCNDETIGVYGGASCQSQCGFETVEDKLTLKEAFFNPSVLANNGIDQVLRGLSGQKQQEIDTKITGSIRNFLFGNPGQGGLDLAALNIQRGRDHGIPDYNTLRSLYGLERFQSFEDISSDQETIDALSEAYADVNNVDAWIGMLAEDHLKGKQIGPTLHKIIKRQFAAIRNGDRFYFENDRMISNRDKELIRATRLADIIARNSDILISEAFIAADCQEVLEYCQVAGMNSKDEWIDQVYIANHFNQSGNDGGYGDFSDQVIDVRQRNYEPVYLKAGYAKHKYVENWKVWIDFNKDGDYNDEGELVFKGRRRKKAKGFMHIPSSAKLGITGMRVSMSYHRQNDPCEPIQYGEIEDYLVNVLPAKGSHRINPENRPTQDIIVAQEDSNISVYPNPALGPTTVRFYSKKEQKGQLSLIHISGKVVYKSNLEIRQGENYIELDVSAYPIGLYGVYLDFEKTGRKHTKLVVVQD